MLYKVYIYYIHTIIHSHKHTHTHTNTLSHAHSMCVSVCVCVCMTVCVCVCVCVCSSEDSENPAVRALVRKVYFTGATRVSVGTSPRREIGVKPENTFYRKLLGQVSSPETSLPESRGQENHQCSSSSVRSWASRRLHLLQAQEHGACLLQPYVSSLPRGDNGVTAPDPGCSNDDACGCSCAGVESCEGGGGGGGRGRGAGLRERMRTDMEASLAKAYPRSPRKSESGCLIARECSSKERAGNAGTKFVDDVRGDEFVEAQKRLNTLAASGSCNGL
jgi:hypothetical protein